MNLKIVYKKVLIKLIIVILIFFNVNNVFAISENLEITGQSAILIENIRGQILFKKDINKKLNISSACKIMTVIIALEKAKLDANVTISKISTNTEGASLKLIAGEKYSVEDLIYAIILTSTNDVAVALAEYIGGDMDSFVKEMNRKAVELKMKNTKFLNPSGQYEENQYSTAYDLSILIRYALLNPDFNRIFASKAQPLIINNETQILINQNKLFWSLEGVDGGKIENSQDSGDVIITSATRNNLRLISIVLDTNGDSDFDDSTKLLNYGFQSYRVSELIKKNEVLTTTEIDGKEVKLMSINDVYYKRGIFP